MREWHVLSTAFTVKFIFYNDYMYVHVYIFIYVYVGLYVHFNINIEFKFFFLRNWDGAPLGDGVLHRLRTLHIWSGGTANIP